MTSRQRLPDFPGFAVEYDENDNPFFKAIVIENLRKIKSVPLGVQLLKQIADAKPRSRSDFEAGINVIVRPHQRQLVQAGHKMTYSAGSAVKDTMVKSSAKTHNPDNCPFYKVGGSQAVAEDAGETGAGGSVSVMNFTNAPGTTSKGETMYPFITLAHELIHCMHHVTGTRKDEGEEEWTTGVGRFTGEPMSENAFRDAFNLPARKSY